MFCINCGHQNKDDAVFCINCGTKQPSAAADNVPPQEHVAPAPPQTPPTPHYTAEAQGYQAAPSGAYAGYAAPAPKKKRTGLIIGLAVGGAVLVAAVVVVVLLLTGGTPVAGIWVNDHNSEVLEFDDDGDVTIYTQKVEIDGTYEYNESSGEGVIETKKKDYDFAVVSDQLVIDKERGFIKDDDDFDIDDFIDDAAPGPDEKPEPTKAPVQAPASTQAPVSAPTAPPAPQGSKAFTIPSAGAMVFAPDGWYVYDDTYNESYVMSLTDGTIYADFYLIDNNLSDALGDIQDSYFAEDIIGSVEEVTIGGMRAYRFQYAMRRDSIVKGYEYVIDLGRVVIEIDMYYGDGDAANVEDATSPEMAAFRAIAESVRMD